MENQLMHHYVKNVNKSILLLYKKHFFNMSPFCLFRLESNRFESFLLNAAKANIITILKIDYFLLEISFANFKIKNLGIVIWAGRISYLNCALMALLLEVLDSRSVLLKFYQHCRTVLHICPYRYIFLVEYWALCL